jgi:hypothetical protein
MSDFSNKAAMTEAMKSLHRYIRSMYISVDLPEFEVSAIDYYFNCDDTKELASYDKMIGAAAIAAIAHNPDIPESTKVRVAQRAAAELQDAFRGAKIDYKFASGKFGVGQESVRKYEREKKENELCRKAAWLDRIKRNTPRQITKIAAKTEVKAALTAGGFTVGGLIGATIGFATGLAVDALWFLTPEEKKEKIKDKSVEIAEKCIKTVNTVAGGIETSPVVQEAKALVNDYVAPIIKPIYDEAKSAFSKVGSGIVNVARKAWIALKAGLA